MVKRIASPNSSFVTSFRRQFRIELLGGDLDSAGRVFPDNVAIKFNTILHRNELTSRVWDTACRCNTFLRD